MSVKTKRAAAFRALEASYAAEKREAISRFKALITPLERDYAAEMKALRMGHNLVVAEINRRFPLDAS